MSLFPPPLFALLLFASCLTASTVPFSFEDVTLASGLTQRRPSLKFGGPLVCDFDEDGNYDLLFSFHNGDRSTLWFGNPNGTFELHPFRTRFVDVHGFSCARRTADEPGRMLTVSPGGGGGNKLKLPEVYLVHPNRTIEDISETNGFGSTPVRGRNVIFMDLSRKTRAQRVASKGGPDVVFVSLLSVKTPELRQYPYENQGGQFVQRRMGEYETENKGHVEVTDVNNDGIMEIISIQGLSMYQMEQLPGETSTFKKSKSIIPDLGFKLNDRTTHAVAELDYDNDGNFDLYVVRGDRSNLSRLKPRDTDTSDKLLRNVGGRYLDVTEAAGIPKDTNGVGVTVGDFNNDGYVDILVILYEEADMFLINQGDGTFQRVDGLIPKDPSTVGNHAVAVDYNQDGKLDVVVGHGGDRPPFRGNYMLMRNVMEIDSMNRWLLVWVGNDPNGTSTSLHAVVTVFVERQRMSRRVGSRGAQAGGGSYIDTIHFGVGRARKIRRVRVKWTSGVVRQVTNVEPEQKISFGNR